MVLYHFESSQDTDLLIQTYKSNPFRVRYASVRSSDSRDHKQPGQDFLCFQVDKEGVSFALCDGVSQSFFGNYAAQYLGQRLLEWVDRQIPEEEFVTGALQLDCIQFLGNITRSASDEVRSYPIPQETPQLLREVLEEKRSIGSETTFVSGRIEVPREDHPLGQILLINLGDSRLRVGKAKELGRLVGGLDGGKSGRWSSRKGLVGGTPSVTVNTLLGDAGPTCTRIVSYTDGLDSLDSMEVRPTTQRLNEIIDQAANSTTSDDCSYIEIELA